MKLCDLPRPAGRKKRRTKRLGRGDATGQGGTSGRGHKGQRARAGGFHKLGFEGGQMPLQRRLPKRGFTNIFRRSPAIINLDQLAKLEGLTEVSMEVLLERGVIARAAGGLKILARGEIKRPLVIRAASVSAAARQKIEAAGGRVEADRG